MKVFYVNCLSKLTFNAFIILARHKCWDLPSDLFYKRNETISTLSQDYTMYYGSVIRIAHFVPEHYKMRTNNTICIKWNQCKNIFSLGIYLIIIVLNFNSILLFRIHTVNKIWNFRRFFKTSFKLVSSLWIINSIILQNRMQ